jgi:phosphatidylserine/phosphatidylglycerophosphate/cardiolipin synthase-like enzyme
MKMDIIHKLPTASLRTLASSLRDGTLSHGITRFALQQIAGARAVELEVCLMELLSAGLKLSQIALMLDTLANDRNQATDHSTLFDLVLSGSDVPGIPTADTAAVTYRLIEEATSEVLLVSYAVHNGQRLFERLAARMQSIPSLHVVLCLDISRKYGETILSGEIVRRFASEFRQKHWPWPQLPELLYDPRSLSEDWEQRSSLHAKCVVVDHQVALITSANLTEAARLRNIEVGVIVRYRPFVERLVGYFEGLRANGQLAVCPLEDP